MSDSSDPYHILGVPQDADDESIKTNYRKLAIACHPDKFTDHDVKKIKEEGFKALAQAYDILINKERRLESEYGHGQDSHRDDASLLDKIRAGSKERKRRPSGMLVTQGFIQGQQVHAMPDTGAGYNIIAASLAQSLGFARPPANAVRGLKIRLANGKYIRAVGVIEAIWSFSPNTRETWQLTFHIIEDFVYDIVLGNEFLMATETMSKHQSRISRIPPPMRALSVLYVNTLGCVTQRLRGTLNGSVVDTLPDSGCESSLLSLQ
ncbi:hypothetical protein VPNG_09263 [Cytospora leucostoma]|uniref:J domain-containing protein n=1 Tax=Cytospora leucostoma TaxID=1230097 RepID=A0A423W0L0_9PEZI|nr:hypothetical protein VPNG_09263 [Cytospora leucostoma]